jgi:hypothetical protein
MVLLPLLPEALTLRTIDRGDQTVMRQCGDCQLCCKLLPVRPLGKKAGQKCEHQRFSKGCAVYHKPGMPPECGLWNCRWIVGDDTGDLSRPDRSHLVVDIMPDFVTLRHNETGALINIEVVQVWIDPRYPNAHRDPAFRAYVERRGREGKTTMIRYNAAEALTLFPPSMSEDRQWHEIAGGNKEPEHTLRDIEQALGGEASMVIEP